MFSNSPRRGADRARTVRPFAEVLEDRSVPAVTVTPISGTTLNISSDNASDSVVIKDDGHTGVKVTWSGNSFAGKGFRRINVNMGNGNDKVTYRQTGNRWLHDMDLNVSLGGGKDTFQGSIEGAVQGGAVMFGTPLRTLDISVNGGSGNDTLNLTANGDADLLPFGIFRTSLWGSSGADTCEFNYEGGWVGPSSFLNYSIGGGADDDTVRATVNPHDHSLGFIGSVAETAMVWGNGGDDDLTHNVFKNPTLPGPTISARADGGDGTDVCHRTVYVTDVNCESVSIT